VLVIDRHPADKALAFIRDPETQTPDPSIVLAGTHAVQLTREALART
jgi:hypothetical protein